MPARPATLTDLTALRRLYAAYLAEDASPYPLFDATDLTTFTAALAERLVAGSPTLLCWVAEESGSVVGFVLGEITQRETGQPTVVAFVHWFFVEPEWRGQGLGASLLAGALGQAASSGITIVELAAKIGDPQWVRRGWMPVAVTYALPIEDAIQTMTRHEGATTTPNGSEG